MATSVLVVDDDPGINRLLQVRLATRGYQVDAATNGKEALDRLATTPPDLIFLDVMMPQVSGLDVLEHVRARGLDLAVIMMTAFGSERVAMEALRRGADDYLRKPFEANDLDAMLTRVVGRLELKRQNAALRRQLDDKRRQLEAELARAEQVQADLLPRSAPALPGFELTAQFRPARQVGGDFYDWQAPAAGTLTLAMGDVMGKGMPAALLMATVRAAMRATVRAQEPAAAIRAVAGALQDDLERAGAFVTLFLARLDVARRVLTYVDAGHGYALMRRANGSVHGLGSRGLPLGIMPEENYTQGELCFDPGDTLVLYSDGWVDALALEGASHAHAAEIMDGASTLPEMMARLLGALPVAAPLPDDVTLVLLRRKDE